ncbi:helix-turn-helix transcriptional regulator [Paludibacterium sp.]|uniref:helix-turn-helix transcriptional regulator n=1 Tax=Paludibacterium sp. TaxID=1917523 RepID=UPI0025D24D1F|nr:helix-turn-helix transcriptional regulator [Paludibacterium sp.]MBV8649597.1 helix-turn-helix transcriptional regulator [Paludibacterium sp.]
MLRLFIILSAGPGRVLIADRHHAVNGAGVSLLLTSAEQVRVGPADACYCFLSAELQSIYRDIHHLLPPVTLDMSTLHTLHSVAAEPVMLSAMRRLAHMSPEAMLHFAFMYCLTVDGGVCAALLRQAISSDGDMFEFIHRHRLKAWPVQRYADTLGLPPRKFNQLFKEKFGVSAKHWLLSQRLEHARQLLLTTHKKVIDVAIESGFTNHAHFSESFRRRFQLSPSEARRETPHGRARNARRAWRGDT